MAIPRELNIAQFAEHMDVIQKLYLIDDDFRSLCDDYCTVQTSIAKFKGTSLRDVKWELEYAQLSVELENEILYYVKNKTIKRA